MNRALSELTTGICNVEMGRQLLNDAEILRTDILKEAVHKYLEILSS